MKHINWINKSNIHLVRINLKYGTFLSDIDLYETRLIKLKDDYLIRYKKGNKIFWYSVHMYKNLNNTYYLTVDLIDKINVRNVLNRKYIPFNRDYILNQILD